MRKRSEDDGEYTTPSGKPNLRPLNSSLGHEDPLESAERHQNGGKHQPLLLLSPEDQLKFSAATKAEDSESWKCAIENEVNALVENKTWSLVPRTEADNILTSKWVFKQKK